MRGIRLASFACVVAKLIDFAVPCAEARPVILVVDDDAEVRAWLQAVPSEGGFPVVTAENSAKALEALVAGAIDLVVLDLHMPALDGFGVLAHVRASDEHRHLPIIVLSGSGDSALKVASLDRGANDFVTKPVESAELLARVRAQLRVVESSRRWREGCLQDALTGLANRRGLEEALRREVARAVREKTPLAVLYVDLDGFKAINDRFGHRVGDQLLGEFGRLLAGLCRAGDVAGRIGDEFLLILPGVARAAAKPVADRLRAAVSMSAVRASVGIAVLFEDVSPRAPDSVAALIDAADAAMYAEKLGG